jgi:hypothetical protein
VNLGFLSVGLYVHRCVLRISLPRCSRVSLASFSSGGYGGVDHFKLGQSISATMTLREVLSEVRESHQDFGPSNAAVACHRLARYVGKQGQTSKRVAFLESDEDKATFQLAIQAAKRTASEMNPQDVSNTLWGFAKLADKTMEVDAAAVGAVSEQALRVAGEMNPQEISNTLWGFAKLAEKGVEVDAAAVRALSAQVPRVAGDMNEHNVSITLIAWSRLAESGIPLTPVPDGADAVLARAKEVWPQMPPQILNKGFKWK